MAYTDVWDVTTPLDTQAANQGAVDFRATKLDVMQRIASFGAGLLAARPTPETTSGTADWTGVMYWATDTKQAFRWSGTAWVDISASLPNSSSVTTRLSNVVPVVVTDDGSAHDGQTLVIPANTAANGSVINIRARAHALASQVTPFSKLALFFGATKIAELRSDTLSVGLLNNTNDIDFSAQLVCVGINVQIAYGTSQIALVNVGSGNFVYGLGNNPGEDITGAITVKTSDEGGINSGGSITFESLMVVVFK